MGEQKWTPEPWLSTPVDMGGNKSLCRDDGAHEWIAHPIRSSHKTKVEANANMDRAAACVNAMQGIADPAEFVRRVRAVVDEWNADHAAVTEPSLCVALVNLGEVLP